MIWNNAFFYSLFSGSLILGSPSFADETQFPCDKISFWTQHQSMKWVKDKKVSQLSKLEKIPFELSKDGPIYSRLWIGGLSSTNFKFSIEYVKDSKPRQLGLFSVKSSDQNKGYFEIQNLNVRKTFEALSVNETLHFSILENKKTLCRFSFAYKGH